MSRPEETPPPGDQMLEDARAKLAAALQAFTAAQSALAAVQSALASGRALPRGNLAELDKVRSALAEAAEALGLDPERATLAELEARLAARGRSSGGGAPPPGNPPPLPLPLLLPSPPLARAPSPPGRGGPPWPGRQRPLLLAPPPSRPPQLQPLRLRCGGRRRLRGG